ncbi:MAG: hypothetical protein M1814_006410 [Vezdaea aestivalis]|nr:MAG: hypothetical protein M1814_006410 [Vezdaea aestivalis]
MSVVQSRSHGGHSHSHDHQYLTSTNNNDPGVRITRIGLFVNLGMAIGKGVGGYVFHSQALIADAFHALTDLVSDFLTLATVSWSGKPATERFPLGYGKIESLGSLGVSGLLLTGGLLMGGNACIALYGQLFADTSEHFHLLSGLGHSHSHSHTELGPNINAAWLAGGSVIVKEWLYRATMAVAKARKSVVLASNAVHHRVDSLTSIVALAAIGGSHFLNNAAWLDPLGGLLVSLMVVRAGWTNTGAALRELADIGVDDEVKSSVQTASTEAIRSIPDVDPEDISLRSVQIIKSGPNFLTDITLNVPKDWSVEKTSDIETHIRAEMKQKVKSVRRLRVRYRPAGEDPDSADEFIPATSESDHNHGHDHSHSHKDK